MENLDIHSINAQCAYAHQVWAARNDNNTRSAHLYGNPPNNVGIVAVRARFLDVTMKFRNGRSTISCPAYIDCGGSYGAQYPLRRLRKFVASHLLVVYGLGAIGLDSGALYFRFEKTDGTVIPFEEEDTTTVRHYLSHSSRVRVAVYPLGHGSATAWDDATR